MTLAPPAITEPSEDRPSFAKEHLPSGLRHAQLAAGQLVPARREPSSREIAAAVPERSTSLVQHLARAGVLVVLAALMCTTVWLMLPIGAVDRPGAIVRVQVQDGSTVVDPTSPGLAAVSVDTYHPRRIMWYLRDSRRVGYQRIQDDGKDIAADPHEEAKHTIARVTQGADTASALTLDALYTSSRLAARIVALRLAGRPVTTSGSGVVVLYGAELDGSFPTRGQEIDHLADGSSVGDVTHLVAATATGGTTDVVTSDGTRGTMTTTPPGPDGLAHLGFAAITRDLHVDAESQVRASIPQGSGGSAGVVMALAIYGELTHTDITKGRTVVVTGGLTEDGLVYPVGGVEQKAILAERTKADLLLVPTDGLATARRFAPSVRVVGIGSIEDAFTALGLSVPSNASPAP